jgi:hypothetical protein
MRLIHPIHPDEELIAWGRYRYLAGGQQVGREAWQVSTLPDGGRIVRADVEGRLEGEASLVAHLKQNGSGDPQWLRLRYRTDELNAAGQYIFEEATIQVARAVQGHMRQLETVEIARDYVIDYHAVITGNYVWRGYPPDGDGETRLVPVFSPDLWRSDEDALIGRALRVGIQPLPRSRCETPALTLEDARCFKVRYDDDRDAVVWFDKHGVPLRWHQPGLDYDCVLEVYRRQLA